MLIGSIIWNSCRVNTSACRFKDDGFNIWEKAFPQLKSISRIIPLFFREYSGNNDATSVNSRIRRIRKRIIVLSAGIYGASQSWTANPESGFLLRYCQLKIFLSWASNELENEYEKWRINEGMNKYSFQMEWVPKIIYDSDIIIIYIRFSNQSKESVKMKSVLYSHSYYTDFFLNPPGCWVSQKSSGKRKQKRREGNLNNLTCSEQFLSSHLSQTAK